MQLRHYLLYSLITCNTCSSNWLTTGYIPIYIHAQSALSVAFVYMSYATSVFPTICYTFIECCIVIHSLLVLNAAGWIFWYWHTWLGSVCKSNAPVIIWLSRNRDWRSQVFGELCVKSACWGGNGVLALEANGIPTESWVKAMEPAEVMYLNNYVRIC